MNITFKGGPASLKGSQLKVGDSAPVVALVGKDLSEVKVGASNKIQILSIFPSIDTGICQLQTKKFTAEYSACDKCELISISRDLPFAFGRFCAAEGIEGAISASDFRGGEFGKAYGLELADYPLAGLLARAVIVIKDGKIAYQEIVSEITSEPDYEALKTALNNL